MSNISTVNKKIKWIGKYFVKVENPEVKHYKSISIDDITISINDFVYVDNADKKSYIDNLNSAFIAKITDFYDNSSNNDNYFASVIWFWRFRELPKKIRNILFSDKEIFLNTCKNIDNVIDAETIVGKCQINFEKVGFVPNEKQNANQNSFYVTRSYDRKVVKDLLPSLSLESPSKKRILYASVESSSKRQRLSKILAQKQLKSLNDYDLTCNLSFEDSFKNVSLKKTPTSKLLNNNRKCCSTGNGKRRQLRKNLSFVENSNTSDYQSKSVRKRYSISTSSYDVTLNNSISEKSVRRCLLKKPRKSSLVVSFVKESEIEPLPGREKEFDQLLIWIESNITSSQGGGCIFISGVPGTGKTATLQRVIGHLKADSDLPMFDLVHVNALSLTESKQAYSVILEQLTGAKTTSKKAKVILDTRWSKFNPRRFPTVLIIDELDVLCNRKQDVVYTLFDWPTWKNANLVVVAVANAMDLPERILSARVSSRLGLTRIIFEPYNHQQLINIATHNLSNMEDFDEEAIELAARKIASLSGDARRMLHVCRYAISISGSDKITLNQVNKAFDDMLASPIIQTIKRLPIHQRFIMQAIISEMNRTGIDEVDGENILKIYTTRCRMEGFTVAIFGNIVSMITNLFNIGLITMYPKNAPKYFLQSKLRLEISADDVSYALAS